jgi:hypothetical protein
MEEWAVGLGHRIGVGRKRCRGCSEGGGHEKYSSQSFRYANDCKRNRNRSQTGRFETELWWALRAEPLRKDRQAF